MIFVIEGTHKLGETAFPEVEMSSRGNLPLMKRGARHRPSS